MGLLLAISAMVIRAVTNVIQEWIADRFETTSSLAVQYACLVIIAGVYVLFFDSFQLSHSTMQFRGLLLGTGAIGYLGIWCLFQGLKRLNVGIVMTIAFSYVFFSYLLNRWLFPEIEALGWQQIVVALCFFGVIVQFLLHKNGTHKIELDRALLYPLATALIWAIFFALINWFIKSGYLTAGQSVFYTELVVGLVAWIILLIKGHLSATLQSITLPALGGYALWGAANFLAGFLSYLAYAAIAANTVNVIGLFGVIMTALLAWIVLGQKLHRREIRLIVTAFLLLVVFMLV